MSRQLQYHAIGICNQCVQSIKGAFSQGHLVHERERSNQWQLPGGGTAPPPEGKLGKRGVEVHGEIDGADDENSTCKVLVLQENVR